MSTFLQLRSAPSGAPFVADAQDDTLLWDVTEQKWYTGPGGGGGGGVTSWNSRTGAVVPLAGDYDSDQVTNLSGVAGATVSDALDTLAAGVGVTSWNSRTGAVVPLAGDYDSDQVANLSSVPGATVSDALDNLGAGGVASWNARTGVVVPIAGDYDSDQVTNVSAVSGAAVSDALDNLATSLVGPAGGDLAGNYPNPTVVAVHTGATQLTIASITAQSLVARVGTTLVSAALGAALSFAAGTLSVGQVSNTTQGVATAITAANAALVSNGGGTAATWQAISGGGVPVGVNRTIATTSPLRIDGGASADLSANRTLSVLAVSNTNAGVAPQTNGTAGQALIATSTSSTWSTDFVAETLTTTGNVVINNAGSFIRMGLAPGSGAGSASASGSIRVPNDVGAAFWQIKARNNLDTADVNILSYSSNPTMTMGVGGTGVQSMTIASTSMSLIGSGSLIVSMLSGVRLDGPTLVFNDTVASPTIGVSPHAGVANTLLISGQQSTANPGGQVILASGIGSTGTTSGLLTLRTGVTTVLEFDIAGSTANFQGVAIIQGAAPATTGDFRTKHGWTQKGRNAAASADFGLLEWGVTLNNTIVVGDRGTSLPNLLLNMGAPRFEFAFQTTVDARLTAGQLDFKPTVANYSITLGGSSVIGLVGALTTRNIALFTAAPAMQSGDRVLYMTDRTAAPTGNPSGGGFHWMETGGLPTWRTVAGNVLTLTATTAATAAAGASTLPVTPQEFLAITINGNARKIALYLT